MTEQDSKDDLVWYQGELVSRKEAKAKLAKNLTENAKSVVILLYQSPDPLLIQQIAKQLKLKDNTVNFLIKRLEKDSLVENALHPKKKSAEYWLTGKGHELAKNFSTEPTNLTIVFDKPRPPWQWAHHAKTKQKNKNTSSKVNFPKNTPIRDRIALTFAENDPLSYMKAMKLVMGKTDGQSMEEFAKWFHLVELCDFARLVAPNEEVYELTDPYGIVWAESVALSYQMATHCMNCGKRILPNEPSETGDPYLCSVPCQVQFADKNQTIAENWAEANKVKLRMWSAKDVVKTKS